MDSWYKRKRFETLCRLSDGIVPKCSHCGKILYKDVEKLHIHHVDEDKGFESGIGGKQHLLRVLEQMKDEEVELEVLCHSCHAYQHDKVLWSPKLEAAV